MMHPKDADRLGGVGGGEIIGEKLDIQICHGEEDAQIITMLIGTQRGYT